MNETAFPFQTPSPLVRLTSLGADFPATELWMKRDDLIHPVVSGNKWRKLKHFVLRADLARPVLTFGGAYSNHLPAAAFALNWAGFSSTAVVRGDELHPESNARLRYCARMGMNLHFISRSDYRELRDRQWQPSLAQLAHWNLVHPQLLPEGGAGLEAQKGCGEIWHEIAAHFIPDTLLIASGTATTALGMLRAMPAGGPTRLVVLSAVRAARNEARAVESLAGQRGIPLLWVDEPFGKFGKTAPLQREHMQSFYERTGIALDPNYNGKIAYWLYENAQHPWLQGRVIWVNSGGLLLDAGVEF